LLMEAELDSRKAHYGTRPEVFAKSNTADSAARKSSPAEYLVPTRARAGFSTREFLARRTRCVSVSRLASSWSSTGRSHSDEPRGSNPSTMFAKKGDEPGAGNAGAHRSVRKKGDGGSNTPNRPLAQTKPSPEQNATIAARALLAAARKRGIHVSVS